MPEALRFPGYSTNYISYLSTAMARRTVAGVTVPDTPVITAALELARKHLDDWSYNHVVRSWLFGCVIAERLPEFAIKDQELHSVAAILHDLGWDEKDTFISTDKCFEVDGANAARTFVEQQSSQAEWDQHRKQLLWDAIALHTYPPVAMYKEPEVVATHLGIRTDFTGPAGVPNGVLTTEEWENISKEYPRAGFKKGVIQTLCGLCRTKPETTYNTFVADFGEQMVEGYSRKGQRLYDIVTASADD